MKTWDELDEKQKDQAGITFNNRVNMSAFVYHVNERGWVTSRSPIAKCKHDPGTYEVDPNLNIWCFSCNPPKKIS